MYIRESEFLCLQFLQPDADTCIQLKIQTNTF